MHIYDKSQPDFNWSNPDVVADFEKTLRFWGDLGVAGFRVDVAAACAKDLSTEQLARKWSTLAQWRKVLNEYDPPLM